MSSASSAPRAPVTDNRTTFVVPSPSATTATASERSASLSAPARALRSTPRGRTPEAPLANAMIESFVDSCPSTLIRSNDRPTASTTVDIQSAADRMASHVTKQSIVASLGEIMPAPLAAKPKRTSPSAVASRRAPCLAIYPSSVSPPRSCRRLRGRSSRQPVRCRVRSWASARQYR